MATTDYSKKDVWRQIFSTTLNNYIFMEKRLSNNKKLSELVLTYYSVFLLINSLTPIFFDWYSTHLSNYFGIILSIVLLAYSLINSNANYTKRIDAITQAINQIKTIKRELTDDNIDQVKKEYNNIVDSVEFRGDIDFFRTVKCQCKELGIKWYQKPAKIDTLATSGDEERISKVKNYLSEISPITLQIQIISKILFSILLFVFPLIVVALCIMHQL